MLVTGWLGEKLYDRALRRYRESLRQTTVDTFTANAVRLSVGLLLDLGGIAVFGVAAVAAFLALWHEHDLQRRLILHVLVAVAIVRVVALFARFLLARETSARLLPFADPPARILRRFVMALATLYAVDLAVISTLRGSGASVATVSLVSLTTIGVYAVIVLSVVWRVRVPIASLIRGSGGQHGAIVGWFADLWPVIATVYFVGIAVGRIDDILEGNAGTTGLGLLSVLLVVALPIVDMALCRALDAAAKGAPKDGAARIRGIVADYELVFRRAIHIIVIVGGLLIFAHLWDIDVFALAQKSMGGKISSSLLGVSIVVLLAYMIWEAAKTAIDRKLDAEVDPDPEVPKSRLRTLLPVLRATILVTIVVMATMSVLAALGVDILPLLAGASVVGVAIGFGSQTLVRDVVSGAFFLMDDAFRLGEYLEVGDAKGRVEKINVRSLFLRHHRGAINILPYGEIKRIRNTSRDWMIMVMDFRLTYDTNLMTVKKIMKQIGEEISADPELAPSLLQPLKMGGVMSTEDSAIVVRAKFTARPEGEPYMIQKAAYSKILKAFREAGIKFAHKQVTVYVPPSQNDDATKTAAAGAAALAAQPASARR